jgi:hypothetical protein
MDWSTNDYTQTYADTIYVPEHEYDSGIYLLSMADLGEKPPPAPAPHKEKYYTGGNIISRRENNRAIFDAAWDERPRHYSPGAGPEWAHLVPPPRGEEAYPRITHSEAQVREGFVNARTHDIFKLILIIIIVVITAMVVSATMVSACIENALKAARNL